jgi:bifunctional ADP-heptose synthase (sugar kinase/adenylyltransferase)
MYILLLSNTKLSRHDSDEDSTGEYDGDYTVGYVDGCFDLMHSGHFNAIRQAK